MLRNRKGFTLIELLIVVVIIGILAAIALPKFGQTREQAYVSAMQSDLRNLQTAQEMLYNAGKYAADGTEEHAKYAYVQAGTITEDAETAATEPSYLLNFTSSSGVEIDLAAEGMQAGVGYGATARHAATDKECTVTVGDPNTSQAIVCQ